MFKMAMAEADGRVSKVEPLLACESGDESRVDLRACSALCGHTPDAVGGSDPLRGKHNKYRYLTLESISRKDPQKLLRTFFSLKSLYHPGMCFGTTLNHSRAPGAPDGHSKCTFFYFVWTRAGHNSVPGSQNFRLEFRAGHPPESVCFVGTCITPTFLHLFGLAGLQTDEF